MADDTATAAPTDLEPIYQQLLQQALQQPQAFAPQAPVERHFVSLLGEALGGGSQYGTSADREAAGNRALLSFGTGMLGASGYSNVRRTLGEVFAQGVGGAQESLARSGSVAAAQLGAQQDYAAKQQEMQLARVKEAVPLLTALQTLQQQKRLAGLGSSLAPGTSIGAAGPGGPGTAPINETGDSATRKAAEGGPPAPGTPAAAVAQQVHDFWISKGFSEEQTAGIMAGGPGSESNFVPTASGDKGTSYGLYQHHAERLDGMRKYFGLSGDQMPTADQQNQYAYWEITQGPKKNVGEMLKAAKTPAEAAAIWTQYFGVPADKTEIGRRALGAGRFSGLYTPQPLPGATTAAAPPGATTGDAAHPELAPGPPGSTGGAPISLGAAVAALSAGRPQYTVAPPPQIRAQPIPAGRGTTAESVQADVEAMQAGRQIAQGSPIPGAVLAAGPAAGTPPAVVATAAPQGGFTAGAGAYGGGPATTTPPPTPTPQAPSQASPAPTPPPAAVTAPAPGGPSAPFVVPEPPQQVRDTFSTTLKPEEEAEFQHRFTDAQRQFQIAQASNNPKGMEDAQKEISAVRQAMIDARVKRYEIGTKAQQDWNAAALTAHNKNIEQQQTFDQQTRLKQIEGEQTRLTNKEAVFNSANQKGLETAQTDQAAARGVVAQLEGFRNISESVGQPGWLQTTKWPGSDHTIAEQLQQAGIPIGDTGGAQLLKGGMINIVKALREGMPMGSLSDRDLAFIERMGPTEWMDPDTRAAAIGYLLQANRAKMAFARDVQKEMSRGKNYGDAVDAVDAKSKPFVPQVPADLTAHWKDDSPEWKQRRMEWGQQNDAGPGTLIHMDDGRIVVLKRPPSKDRGQG